MNSTTYFKTGKWLYALAVLAFGMIQLVTLNFPKGLMPVPAGTPERMLLVHISYICMTLAGVLILVKRDAPYGAYMAAAIWMVLLLLLHLPKLFAGIYNGGEWTATFEVVALLSGACMLGDGILQAIGRYCFALALLVFGIQHYIYGVYVATLVPGWIPFHLFWAYFVMVVFVLAAISIVIRVKTQLAALLLCLMFLLWVIILHLPRAIAKPIEPEWTSLFVALAMGGIALLIAGQESS